MIFDRLEVLFLKEVEIVVTIVDVTDLSRHRRHAYFIRFHELGMPFIDPHLSEKAVPATDSHSS